MKIELSPDEYRTLLDILHTAEIIISGHRREDDPRSHPHRQLLQKIYALAGEGGLGSLFTYHAEENRHHPSEAFENSTLAHRLIDEFAEHAFWDQLIMRLTKRDAGEEAGGDGRLREMSDEDREAVERPIHERYVREFSQHGIENLAVVERFGDSQQTTVRTSD